jgi:hypothetical protein
MLIVILAAGYVAYWFYGTTLVRDGVENWIAAARAEGVEAAHAGLEVSGFPNNYHIAVARPSIAGASQGARWDWKSEAAVADIRPYDFRTIRLSLTGAQTLNFTDGGDRRMSLRSPGPTLIGLEIAGDTLPRRISVDANLLDITDPPEFAGLRLDSAGFTAVRRSAGGSTSQGEGLDLAFDFERVTLPPSVDALLGVLVDRIRGDLDLAGRIQEGPPRAAAAAWRDDGGRLGVRSLFVKWGALDLNATGSLVLDGNLQPAGRFTVVVTGYGALIDSFVSRGFVKAKDAIRVKALMDLLAKPSADGGPRKLTAPLTLSRGKLFLGPIALMALPRIVWPE